MEVIGKDLGVGRDEITGSTPVVALAVAVGTRAALVGAEASIFAC
jgi:hypothetical protein